MTSASSKPALGIRADDAKSKVYVVLVKASLETVKTKKGYELLCADTHNSIIKKLGRQPGDFRPDILHSALLTLLDSPLNKSGHLKVFIHTTKNELIEVSPHIRIPRTYKRFAGLMVQLMHKLKIRAADGPEFLLKVVKNPVTQYLPAGCRKIGTSVKGDLVDLKEFVPTLVSSEPELKSSTGKKQPESVCFVFGAHAHGPAKVDFTEQVISVSRYPLSAATALSRLCTAFENHWNIL
eukprot:TRINITY_DN6349_c0_g1_i1.p1 TRINITY_DN6349_c0_g1~~TRINITY_DN6349_c0_g1_i1.p1  ORF type:complete len:238 (-),score=31.21 TRINITY_DN6349_c0_g1_i1:355-1068(-)